MLKYIAVYFVKTSLVFTHYFCEYMEKRNRKYYTKKRHREKGNVFPLKFALDFTYLFQKICQWGLEMLQNGQNADFLTWLMAYIGLLHIKLKKKLTQS